MEAIAWSTSQAYPLGFLHVLRIGWTFKKQAGSHRKRQRPGWRNHAPAGSLRAFLGYRPGLDWDFTRAMSRPVSNRRFSRAWRVSRGRSSRPGSRSKNHARQEPDLIQIRANCGIPHAEIAIYPARQPHLWLKPEPLELEPNAASDNKTRCAAVSKFSEGTAFQAIELFAERTARAFGCAADTEHAVERDASAHERPRRSAEPIDECHRHFPSPDSGAP